MAEQEIDKLLLEIEVDDKTQGGSKKLVDDFATAVSKLNEQIAKLDVSKFETIAKAMPAMSASGGGGGVAQSTKKVSAELKQANKELAELQKRYEDFKSSGVQGEALESIRQQLRIPEAEQRVAELQKQGGTAPQLPETSNQVEQFEEVTSLAEVYQQQLEIVNAKLEQGGFTQEKYLSLKKKQLTLEKQITKENERQNKSETSNLFASIKRVATYRLIRAAIKFVVDALKEGAETLAQISPTFNTTWSSVLTSMDKIKGALATIGANLLPIIEPIIRWVADLLVTVSNTIGQILAAFNGTGEAIQTNTKYQKDYNKELKKGSLLAFDTFTTMKTTEQSDLYNVQDSGAFGSGLTGIIDSLTPIIDFINELITILTDVLMPVIASIGDIVGGVGDQISASFKFIAGLLKLLTGDFEGAWNLIGESCVQMVNGIANMFIALAKFIIDALNVLFVETNPLFWVLKAFGIDVGEKISSWNASWSEKAWNPIKNHAFGGGYDSADLFYANENGRTELIASTNSGGGAVMNMQQLESAIYSGMIKAMASNSSNGESAVYLDGNKVGTFVASNSGFRNEANRRMTGLNWR